MVDDLCEYKDAAGLKQTGYSPSHEWDVRQTPWSFGVAMVLVLIVLGWVVWALLRASFAALFGFGVPLGVDARRPQAFNADYPLRNASLPVEAYLAHVRLRSRDVEEAFRCLVRETIPLSREVIFGVLANDAKGEPMPTEGDLPALDDIDTEHRDAFEVVLAWAWRVDAPSRVEAVDYLRGLLNDRYRELWKGLSRREQIDLHHLARGRIINVSRTAPVITSFLRKGLIVLDPRPRLMNESFAAFVRQVQPSSTISAWARRAGLSAWSSSRLPLLIGAPALVMSAGLILLWTGTDAATILPVIVTGIPALVAALQRLRSQVGG